MGRLLSSAFCVALLAAAAAAFALTEGAKTELSPVYGTKIDSIFSPTCNRHICPRRYARIDFKLRRRERLQVWVKSQATGDRVATIVIDHVYPRGLVRLAFDGRDEDGTPLPDGGYVPVARLVGDLTLTFPNVIRLDTVPPRVIHQPRHLVARLDPGSSGEPQQVLVPYTLSAAGHGVLFADGRRVGLTYRERLHATLVWKGLIAGRPVPAGRYTLELAVRDEADNQSRPERVGVVTVAYLTLAATRYRVAPQGQVHVRVLVGPAHVSWRLAGRHGSAASHKLELRAPRRRGSYPLVVSGGGHAVVARVVVTGAYLTLAATRYRVAPRGQVRVQVLVGPAHVSWRFAGRHGSAATHELRLQAPKRRGSYPLIVSGGGQTVVALVVVA